MITSLNATDGVHVFLNAPENIRLDYLAIAGRIKRIGYVRDFLGCSLVVAKDTSDILSAVWGLHDTPLRKVRLPYSEVCMHMRVAGTEMLALPTRNHMVQLYTLNGVKFSFPITEGEAGF